MQLAWLLLPWVSKEVPGGRFAVCSKRWQPGSDVIEHGSALKQLCWGKIKLQGAPDITTVGS